VGKMAENMSEEMEKVDLDGDVANPEQKNDVENDDEDFVDPWNVESKSAKGIDYDKLISGFHLLYYSSFPDHQSESIQ
jgi:hypothetical protein